jgi:hypothetical protein
MRRLLLIFFCSIQFNNLAQCQILGQFSDGFGKSILIKADSTFNFSYKIHLSSSSINGHWRILNDTIFFFKNPVFDTLIYTDLQNKFTTKLIPSIDDKIDVIEQKESKLNIYILPTKYIVPCPEKLFYWNNKLYRIKSNGELFQNKFKIFFSKRSRSSSWFLRVN